MSIRDELESLQQQSGVLKAEDVVEWARVHSDSALHGAIEWDDAVAGHNYRLWQVRQLISIHVVSNNRPRQAGWWLPLRRRRRPGARPARRDAHGRARRARAGQAEIRSSRATHTRVGRGRPGAERSRREERGGASGCSMRSEQAKRSGAKPN
jgi:hypothetical protein